MIQKIIGFSIKHKMIVGLFIVAWVVGGLFALKHLPLGAVPDITNNQVQVITTSPSLSTTDIERFVTYPIELSMANLPGVTEIRSISRFGLSVVTVVFKDNMGTYLPRQLVNEKLAEVRDDIPERFGQPEMGPISSGLGEIYQYYLDVAPEFKNQFNDTLLRSIQDWIIRRQMSMVPGVVEVNSFGGHVKQYEVSLDPDRLRNMGLTISDVFEAIEHNNANTGGAYIERNHQANYIRGEGLIKSLDDIRNIAVKTKNGYPILIKDVGTVQFGSGIRYGAFTLDGKGEAVGGTVMMLKGGSQSEVSKNIKERIDQIQKSLPEGVTIQPFLDRSDLISRTTHTVSKNLIEGALIVIFVLVLLLGHLRGGLIVASIIPLSLLFAFILMKVFNVSANLMSLGAIDFGILVDGAVIIGEGAVHLMEKQLAKFKGREPTLAERDQMALDSGSEMMHSAFFGQLIILIVFLPILFLTGIEGKMFRPMALTFGFAVLGAMILCLTYVPMMTALFMHKGNSRKNIFEKVSKKLMAGIERLYRPLIVHALRGYRWVLGAAGLLLLITGFVFHQMGAVFIPNLDEGDIAMQAILKPGTALNETIDASTKIQKILLKNFPEVKHVATRMGVSEIPTDPDPMDVADVFILMKPKKEWTSAKNKEDLIQKMEEALSVLPGINYEFSQPVELRFNELLTGVRQDVAIKIYGDDLNILSEKAEALGRIVNKAKGVGDIHIEATSGLPQITIQFNREKMGQYGLQLDELNTLIEAAFAGRQAGQVFEGEQAYDLVIRLNKDFRQSIEDVQNLYVALPDGNQVPLSTVADISYQPGPMQISRDNTNRRVYVGINVRGRDVESLIHEIMEHVDAELHLPVGYYVTYGGEFENLQNAKARLGVVVPIVLILIFLLLYFALRNVKQAVMIYVAIPLAAIGGVFSLYLRGLPFSISAGVGFIVLFGVVILNGLVLINSLNDLKMQGITDLKERIYQGTHQRLRPILLTAVSAIMGFLPMALSTSAGAEVQRPLATVVIGGLVTATLLTLIVIPILYYLSERKMTIKITSNKVGPILLLLIFFQFSSNLLSAQTQAAQDSSLKITSLSMAEDLALRNNPLIKAAETNVEEKTQQQKSVFSPEKTNLYYQQEEFGRSSSGIRSYGISQTIDFPTVYTRRKKVFKQGTKVAEQELELHQQELKRAVREAWFDLQTAYLRLANYEELDSFYTRFYDAALLRLQTGEATKLEVNAARAEESRIHLLWQNSRVEVEDVKAKLLALINVGNKVEIPGQLEPKAGISGNSLANIEDELLKNKQLLLSEQQATGLQQEVKLARAEMLPSLNGGYALQQINGQSGFHQFQVGIGIPLFFQGQKAKIKTAELAMVKSQYLMEQQLIDLKTKAFYLTRNYIQAGNQLAYFEEQGLPLAKEILEDNEIAFREGEIGYEDFIKNVGQALQIREDYFNQLKNYNHLVVEMKDLFGE